VRYELSSRWSEGKNGWGGKEPINVIGEPLGYQVAGSKGIFLRKKSVSRIERIFSLAGRRGGIDK